LFDVIGVGDAIDRAGFVRSTGNTVWWGSDEPRVERFAEGALGWQVELQRFSDVLLDQAVRAGVIVERRVMTAEATRSAVARSAEADQVVLDCSGRSGIVARLKDVRQYDQGPRTVALVGEWSTAGSWSVADDTHTVIESYGDGWMWSVPVARGVRHVSAMVDPQRSGLARNESARGVYLAEIAKTRQFKRLLDDAVMLGGPWGHDASTYRAIEYAGDGWLLVGDAGSFIDPLSSAGVKKALASAWLAAVVAHTCVKNPSMRPHALAFFSAREREIEQRHAQGTRQFLTAAAREHRQPFWAERLIEAEPDAGATEAVRAAFERLKTAKALRLQVSEFIAIAPRPYVDGHEIALGPHVVTSADDPGVRYLYNVDVPALFELAPTVREVPDLFDAYVRRSQPVSLHDFLLAVSTAVAKRWLVAQ
jgi:flavin-dependent dehydrogenase